MSKKRPTDKVKCKRKSKISLPRDRNGVPVNLGDWIMFDEGPIHITALTVYKDGGWSASSDDDDYASDNLSGGVIISID